VPANYVAQWRKRLHKEAQIDRKLLLHALLLVSLADLEILGITLRVPLDKLRLGFPAEIFIGRLSLVLTLMVFLVILHEALHALPLSYWGATGLDLSCSSASLV
jgi:hypothetical protein